MLTQARSQRTKIQVNRTGNEDKRAHIYLKRTNETYLFPKKPDSITFHQFKSTAQDPISRDSSEIHDMFNLFCFVCKRGPSWKLFLSLKDFD